MDMGYLDDSQQRQQEQTQQRSRSKSGWPSAAFAG
jgi:hypothetical protein